MKRDEQQEGPPAPPSKRQKIEMTSDNSLLQPSVGLDSKFRKLHRRELVDFFLREAEAASCKDLMSFIGDIELVETAIVPGAVSDEYKEYRKASDALKLISHKLVNFFSNLQLSGWSFCGKISMPDVLVTPLGHVRMRKSNIWSLKPQSNRRNRKDFRCLVRVFLKVLEQVEKIPADILRLLNLMKDFSEKVRTLMTRNPATMTEQERLSILDRLYRSYEALAENDDRLKAVTDALSYSDLGENGNYLVRAFTNNFLVGVLKYKNPLWLAVPKKEKDKSLYPQGGRGVLKLNRNAMQHAFKAFGTESLEPGNKIENSDKDDEDKKKLKKNKRKKRPPKKQRIKLGKPVRVLKFHPIQVDHMLGNAFPGLLCEFAELMNDVGLYEDVIQELKLPATSKKKVPLQELKLPATSKKKIDGEGSQIYWEHEHVDHQTLPITEVRNHYRATEDRPILLNLDAFSRIRPVLGDGECFYRSFIYSYLEQVLDRQDTHEEHRLLDTVKRLSTEHKNLGWETSEFRRSYKAFKKLIKKIMEWKRQDMSNNIASTNSYRKEKLLEFFSTYNTTNDIFVFLRLLVAIHICSHSDQYEVLIPELNDSNSLKDWCFRVVTQPREFTDHLMMTALATALGVTLRLERLYGGGSDQDNMYTGPGAVSVILLYTGNHYDIIYPSSPAVSSIRQASQGEDPAG